MYFVQPDSLQECLMVYRNSNAFDVPRYMPHKVSASRADNIVKKEVDEENSAATVLMTPAAFNSPPQNSSCSLPPTVQVGSSTTPPPPAIPAPGSQDLLSPPRPIIRGFDPFLEDIGSSGSTPSREVVEILSASQTKITDEMLGDVVQQENDGEKGKAPEANVCAPTAEDCSSNTANATTLAALMESVVALTTQQAHDFETLKKEILQSIVENSSGADLEALIVQAITGALANQPQPKVDVDSIAAQVSSVVSSDIGRQLVREIKPAFGREVDAMKNRLLREISHKLDVTDQAFKETLGKNLSSKNVADALSQSFNASASAAMQEVIKDSVAKVAMPIFEKAANLMFRQINCTLADGIKEFNKELTSSGLKASERANVELKTLQTSIAHLDHATEAFSSSTDEDLKKFEKIISDLERIANEMSLNVGYVQSGSVTPALHVVDSQVLRSQISHLISQGRVNAAFQQALSASDLNLVLYCCEKFGTEQVFDGPGGCQLQQHVLLSLIQQLSADMSQHTEANQKYLEEAIMCLDVNNKDTKEHMPGVLANLSRQLELYVAVNPSGRLSRKAKILQMATQALLSTLKQ